MKLLSSVKLLFFLIIGVLLFLLLPDKTQAVFNFTKNINPIFLPSFQYWDQNDVQNPRILLENGVYRMWYEGNNGSGWRLGYAESPNGIDSFLRNNQPLASLGGAFESEMSDPFVIHKKLVTQENYYIWYSSYNFSLQFKTRLLISSDNEAWNNVATTGLSGTIGSWDNGGTARGRSVIYDGVIYHMWYAATSGNWIWRIGYATSPDGLNWTKQNNAQPVIFPEKLWEYSNVSYPYVFFYNGLYHMFYATGPGDLPTTFAYAYSTNGIDWTKPENMNPVMERTLSWENSNIASPYVLIEDNKLKMWYSALGFYNNRNQWQIAYAEAPLSDLYGAKQPTPTPPPTKKVIVIPGVTASWNRDALLNCKLTNYEGNWELIDKAHDIYDPLINSLDQAGWHVTLYPYDWRIPINENVNALKTFINEQLILNEKINIVGHSMGGLLGQAYLIQEQDNAKTDKLLTVGSPHSGALSAYPTWSAGNIKSNDPLWKFYLTLLLKRCSVKSNLTDRDAVQTYFKSTRNLLPTFSYLQNKAGKQKDVQFATNDWLPTPLFSPPFWNVQVGTLRGTGQLTEEIYEVKEPSKHDVLLGNWADGNVNKVITTSSGDGTVLLKSAEIQGADNSRVINEKHIQLVSSPIGVQSILNFLGVPEQTIQNIVTTIQPPTEITSGLFFASNANLFVTGPDLLYSRDSSGLLSIFNPKSGAYRLIIVPNSENSLLIAGQILSNGKILYKEYEFKNRLPKIKTIQFYPENTQEELLF